MARRRFIPTDFWESPTATSLSAGARLFLLGCWTAADDEGLLRWDAEEFKERFFPSDDKVTADGAVTGWMQDLIRQRLVLPYRDRTGSAYAYLLGFERDHKTPRPVASTLPPPNPRHSTTVNAYAWRDKGLCARCNTIIMPIPGARQQTGATPDTGVIVPADTDATLYPSQALVVHQRCLNGDTDAAVTAATQSNLTDPDSVDTLATEPENEPTGEAAEPNSPVEAVDSVAAATEVVEQTTEAVPNPSTPETPEAPEAQDSLFSVPADMVKTTPEPARKKKRKQPATWTADRKTIAKSLMEQWWPKYGEGWPQSYGTVYGVIISVLANKVPADDITKAMEVLGAERKPISGGTITFALSHPSKKVREQEAFKERSAARDADRYQQRTL